MVKPDLGEAVCCVDILNSFLSIISGYLTTENSWARPPDGYDISWIHADEDFKEGSIFC